MSGELQASWFETRKNALLTMRKPSLYTVFASEAKQSQSIDKKIWIASSLLLLAMTSSVIQGRASLARARSPWRHHSAGRNGFRVRIFDAPRNDVPPKNPISQTRSTLSRLSSRRPKNISLNPPGKSHLRLRASRLDKRGVGHRHERWAVCGGRFGGARRAAQKADGEVVWS